MYVIFAFLKNIIFYERLYFYIAFDQACTNKILNKILCTNMTLCINMTLIQLSHQNFKIYFYVCCLRFSMASSLFQDYLSKTRRKGGYFGCKAIFLFFTTELLKSKQNLRKCCDSIKTYSKFV